MDYASYEARLRQLFQAGYRPENAISACRAALGSLPIVVKALLDNSRKKIRIDMSSRYSTGSTDGSSVIRLPKVPLPTDDSDVNAYYKIAAFFYGLIHHEVGHINRTDMDAYRAAPNKLVMHILNIVDDVWQELEHIKQTPAARRYLDGLMMAAAMRDFFKPVSADDHPTTVFTSYLLYRLRAEYRKDPVSLDLYPSAKAAMESVFTSGVLSRMQPVLAEFQQVKSSGDGLQLAIRLYNFLIKEKEQADEEQSQQQNSNQQQNQQQSTTDDDADDSDDQQQADPDDSDADPQTNGQDSTNDEDPSGSGSDDDDSTSDDSQQEDAADNSPSTRPSSDSDDTQQGATSDADKSDSGQAQSALDDLLQDDAIDENAIGDLHKAVKEMLEEEVGKSDSDEELDLAEEVSQEASNGSGQLDIGASHDMQKAHAVSMPIRRLMVKELNSLAEEQILLSSRGRKLSSRHLTRVVTGDTRVFMRNTTTFGLNTAVCLLQDVSGSMVSDDRITVASQANFAAASALYGIEGLDICAVTFPGHGIILPYKRDPRGLKDNFQLKATGWSTPMGEGITFCNRMLRISGRQRKILVVLTDGEPDSYPRARTAVDVAKAHGIEVFGIGIQTDAVKNIFPEWTAIDQLDQLPTRLVGLLRKKIFDSLIAA